MEYANGAANEGVDFSKIFSDIIPGDSSMEKLRLMIDTALRGMSHFRAYWIAEDFDSKIEAGNGFLYALYAK